MTAIQAALVNALPIFIGTLPLLAVIFWAAFQQNQRISRLEIQFDAMNARMQAQFDAVNAKLDRLVELVAQQNERIAVIETKIDGPRLVGSR